MLEESLGKEVCERTKVKRKKRAAELITVINGIRCKFKENVMDEFSSTDGDIVELIHLKK